VLGPTRAPPVEFGQAGRLTREKEMRSATALFLDLPACNLQPANLELDSGGVAGKRGRRNDGSARLCCRKGFSPEEAR